MPEKLASSHRKMTGESEETARLRPNVLRRVTARRVHLFAALDFL